VGGWGSFCGRFSGFVFDAACAVERNSTQHTGTSQLLVGWSQCAFITIYNLNRPKSHFFHAASCVRFVK
jgi:hypothetical protein